MSTPLQKTRQKIADGRLVTHYDLAALRRQLTRAPENSPEEAEVAAMISRVRPFVWTPVPWWARVARFVGALSSLRLRYVRRFLRG